MPLALRHTDQNEIVFVGDLNEPLIHIGEIHAHIIQHHPHFPALNEPQQIGALSLYIMDAVEKAGNDDLTAGVFVVVKHLVDQDPRIGRFQYGDRRHDLFQPACAANHASLLQGRQLQQVGYGHAHGFTFFFSWTAFKGCSHRSRPESKPLDFRSIVVVFLPTCNS